MSITVNQAQTLTQGSAEVRNRAGKIGKVGQVYLDDTTGEPSWVTVKTGLFGSKETFVPLNGATLDGSDVVVDFDEDLIKDAPRVDPDGSLSPEEEDRLYDYYSLSGSTDTHTSTGPAVGTRDADTGRRGDQSTTTGPTDRGDTGGAAYDPGDRPIDADDPSEVGDDRADRSGEPGVVGYDRSGPATDDAMTRSEEQLRVGTTTREAGRARLRKYVTTETVTQTVPVSHEEVTLQREPITDANIGDATSGPAISEEEHEVVLHEEVPVVDKDVVAVERVRLGTETVTEDRQVSGEVRKENVELVDPTDTSGAPGQGQTR